MKKLLIIGCGDVARRALPALTACYEVAALSRHPQDLPTRVRAISADLDTLETPAWSGFPADCVLHSAPPGDTGTIDQRTRRLLACLAAGGVLPRRLVYIRTSGVYGDCAGEWVDESRPVNPMSDRARRRVDAEARLLEWGAATGVKVSVLRAPGIYAADRLPVERLRRGTPALRDEDDVFSNHIHAEDLAAIIAAALNEETAVGIFNASDDTEMKMGDYFDLVADRYGLGRPQRIARADAAARVSPELLSFWSESRRIVNRRMKHELRVQLRYPSVREGVPVLSEAQ